MKNKMNIDSEEQRKGCKGSGIGADEMIGILDSWQAVQP